jgi:proteasome accessory factor B
VLLAAVSDRKVVQFSHRKPLAEAAEKRTIEPWGVLSWRGRWYVVGHDRAREDVRSFRLDRITGGVRVLPGAPVAHRPDKIDMLALVRGADPQRAQSAKVRVSRGRAIQLRRMARSTVEDGETDLLMVDFRDSGSLAALIAAAGVDAVALEPPALVSAVITLLQGAAGAPGGRQ